MTFASGKNLLNYFQKDKILRSKKNETTCICVRRAKDKGLKKVIITCLWGYNEHGAHEKSILFRRWESLL